MRARILAELSGPSPGALLAAEAQSERYWRARVLHWTERIADGFYEVATPELWRARAGGVPLLCHPAHKACYVLVLPLPSSPSSSPPLPLHHHHPCHQIYTSLLAAMQVHGTYPEVCPPTEFPQLAALMQVGSGLGTAGGARHPAGPEPARFLAAPPCLLPPVAPLLPLPPPARRCAAPLHSSTRRSARRPAHSWYPKLG